MMFRMPSKISLIIFENYYFKTIYKISYFYLLSNSELHLRANRAVALNWNLSYTNVMNEISTNINAITNPQEAVDQYVGEQFIEWLMDYIPHQMNSWPIIQKIQGVQAVKPEKIKKLMLQVFLAAEALMGSREGDPGFLRFAVANLSESDDPTAESALEILEAKRQNELVGHKIDRGILQTARREQWLRLLKSMALTEEEIDRAEAKEPTRYYVAELSDVYSNSEWQTAIGAFAGHERALVEEYKALMILLKNNFSLTDKDLEVLADHSESKDKFVGNTSHILDKIVFDREAKELVWEGVKRQLEIRQEFLSGLEKYLEN